MERKGSVYALRHNKTGKIYVGYTYHRVEFRIRQHIVALRGHRHPVELMQFDYEKYGDDYSYFVLFESKNPLEASMREKIYMDLLRTRDPNYGYNYKDNTKDFSLCNLKEHHIPREGE